MIARAPESVRPWCPPAPLPFHRGANGSFHVKPLSSLSGCFPKWGPWRQLLVHRTRFHPWLSREREPEGKLSTSSRSAGALRSQTFLGRKHCPAGLCTPSRICPCSPTQMRGLGEALPLSFDLPGKYSCRGNGPLSLLWTHYMLLSCDHLHKLHCISLFCRSIFCGSY